MERKKFAIIGLGRFGMTLVEELSRMGLEVIAIDQDESKIEEVKDLATESLVLERFDKKSLEEAGIKEADVVIVGMGKNIEVSVLVTTILKELGIKQIISRAEDSLHARILKKVGADRVIFPEKDMAIRLAHSVHFPGVQEYIDLKGPWDLAEIKIGPKNKFVEKTIKQARESVKNKIEILVIEKEKKLGPEEKIIRESLIPYEDYVIKQGDFLILFGEPKNLESFIQKGKE